MADAGAAHVGGHAGGHVGGHAGGHVGGHVGGHGSFDERNAAGPPSVCDSLCESVASTEGGYTDELQDGELPGGGPRKSTLKRREQRKRAKQLTREGDGAPESQPSSPQHPLHHRHAPHAPHAPHPPPLPPHHHPHPPPPRPPGAFCAHPQLGYGYAGAPMGAPMGAPVGGMGAAMGVAYGAEQQYAYDVYGHPYVDEPMQMYPPPPPPPPPQ